MRRSLPSLLGLAVTSPVWLAATARAEQFIAADVTYTHSAATTQDSHYFVSPRPETPADWTSPIDYRKGSVHVLLEVKTKPTATPTRYEICFDVRPEYACTAQVPPYTTTGVYEWTTPVSELWSPPGTVSDWTQGVRVLSLILKDTNNEKPQGDPNYVPTDLHVEVAVLSEGAVYVPTKHDAGAPDAGGTPLDASTPSSDAATPVVDASAPPDVNVPPPDTRSSSDAGEPSRDAAPGAAIDGGGDLVDAREGPVTDAAARFDARASSEGGPARHGASGAAGGLNCGISLHTPTSRAPCTLSFIALLAGIAAACRRRTR